MAGHKKGPKPKSNKADLSKKIIETFKTKNKEIRKLQFIKQKKARDVLKRDERFKRRREEDKNPALKEARLAVNVPKTLDSKRVWDQIGQEEADGVAGSTLLGRAVDLTRLDEMVAPEAATGGKTKEGGDNDDDGDSDMESMLAITDDEEDGSEEEDDDDDVDDDDSGEEFGSDRELDDQDNGDDDSKSVADSVTSKTPHNSGRTTTSTSISARMDLVPDALVAKFPTLFEPIETPKILVTTGLNGTVHDQAKTIATLFPNSTYIRRSGHRFGHKYSIREISKFAANRDYSALVVLQEYRKKPSAMTVVHLPAGPTFHFSISNWVDGKRIRGHGKAADFYPELLLNNFRTPLGLLTAHLFRTLFPIEGEHEGRQVVTLHNQRDYIFVRNHRYIFREKRETEKSIVGTDGKVLKGAEDIRTGLQELGPRFTLKLRRIDKGIQKASGQEWKWKAESEKVRTRFQL